MLFIAVAGEKPDRREQQEVSPRAEVIRRYRKRAIGKSGCTCEGAILGYDCV